MASGDTTHLEAAKKKYARASCEIKGEPTQGSPESLWKGSETPTNQENPEEEESSSRSFTGIQRHSIFNRAVRYKSKVKAKDTPEKNVNHTADSPEDKKSVNGPLTSTVPQSRRSLWKIPTQVEAGAPKTSESSSTPGNGTTPEECPALADSPTTLTEALQMIHPIPADSWRILIEQIGLLYQEYRDKSTLQEIETRRKQDAEIQAGDDGSPASEEAPEEEEEAEEEELPSPPERKALPQICLLSNPHSRFNLWQDLPEIRSSGVLDILQPEEIRLQEAMFELVTSEASYYKSLNLLVSHFVDNERLKKLLHPSEAHILFSNVLDVMAVSERFLLELERRMEESIVISDVCDIVYRYAADHFSVYITYVSNQTYQERTYKQLLQEKAAFRELITQLELDPKCKGLPLSSFLILPFQRITRLKLLVQNILKRVEERSERECTALEAHKELEMVVKACNEGVRKMSRTEQMISIQKKMEFKIKSVPIISHSRWLLKQGELQQMSGPKTSRTLRTKKLFQEIYLFLFNDLLVICRQIPGDKFQVFDSAPRGLLRVEELEDQGQTLANVFILRLLENADDREATYMLKAASQ